VSNEDGLHALLGAFAKLQKTTVVFVMYFRVEQLGSHWADFHEIWYLSSFRQCVEKIQVSWKSMITGTLHEDQYICTRVCIYIYVYIFSYLAHFFLEWEMFQKDVVEEFKTHIFVFKTFLFRSSCRLWNNVEKYSRAGQANSDNMAHAHFVLDT